MIGVLGTVLVQSSSTFTSIIVAAIGAGMKVHIAVPMMMGANIAAFFNKIRPMLPVLLEKISE